MGRQLQSRYTPTVRIAIAGVALLAAALGFLAAPGNWTSGSSILEVTVGDTTLTSDVVVGSDSPILFMDQQVTVEAGRGIPVDGPLDVTVSKAGSVLALGDVEVTLFTSDGERQTVPVLRQEEGGVVASRRPPQRSGVVLALLGAVVVLWVTEFVPLFVTSLAIPVVLLAGGAASLGGAVSPFAHPIIVLFFAGFLMAEAMARVGLDKLAAAAIVSRAGKSPLMLFSAMLAGSAFLSMWMSNTAAVTILVPVALAIAEPTGSASYRKAIVLGIAYASTIGGVGSAIGTPANPLAIEFIDELTGRQIGFAEWFLFGLPMVFLFLPLMGTYLWKVSRVSVDRSRFDTAAAAARSEMESIGRLTGRQVRVLGVFALVMAGWLTQNIHGQATGMVALAGAALLALMRQGKPGVAMVDTGTSDWLVTQLGGLVDWPTPVAIAAVAVAALVFTTVASNTAAAATLIPLAIPLAGLIGIDPVALVLVVALASSIDFALVIGTPPTMLAYDTGLFTASEIMAKGSPLDLGGLVLLVGAVVPFWYLVGLI